MGGSWAVTRVSAEKMKSFIRESAEQYPDAYIGIYATLMPLADGEEVEKLIASRTAKKLDVRGPLQRIAAGAYKALNKLHRHGFAHNDVKPENMFYNKDSHEVNFIDTGFARKHSRGSDKGGKSEYVKTTYSAGTPGFLSPRVTYGKAHGPETDFHALACTLLVATERSIVGALNNIFDRETHRNPLLRKRILLGQEPRDYLPIIIAEAKKSASPNTVAAAAALEQKLTENPDFEEALVNLFIVSSGREPAATEARALLARNSYLNPSPEDMAAVAGNPVIAIDPAFAPPPLSSRPRKHLLPTSHHRHGRPSKTGRQRRFPSRHDHPDRATRPSGRKRGRAEAEACRPWARADGRTDEMVPILQARQLGHGRHGGPSEGPLPPSPQRLRQSRQGVVARRPSTPILASRNNKVGARSFEALVQRLETLRSKLEVLQKLQNGPPDIGPIAASNTSGEQLVDKRAIAPWRHGALQIKSTGEYARETSYLVKVPISESPESRSTAQVERVIKVEREVRVYPINKPESLQDMMRRGDFAASRLKMKKISSGRKNIISPSRRAQTRAR